MARKFCRFVGVVALTTCVATPAFGQEVGTSASGSVGIRVVIQPLGGAVTAQRQFGAVGLWTFTGAQPGLMISAPQSATAGEAVPISLFARNTATLTVRSLEDVVAGGTDRAFTGGLMHREFSFRPALPAAGRNSQVFVVASL